MANLLAVPCCPSLRTDVELPQADTSGEKHQCDSAAISEFGARAMKARKTARSEDGISSGAFEGNRFTALAAAEGDGTPCTAGGDHWHDADGRKDSGWSGVRADS